MSSGDQLHSNVPSRPHGGNSGVLLHVSASPAVSPVSLQSLTVDICLSLFFSFILQGFVISIVSHIDSLTLKGVHLCCLISAFSEHGN